jgi:hypothetical protein
MLCIFQCGFLKIFQKYFCPQKVEKTTQKLGTHVESWTSPLFYTRFHTFCTFMDHGQWSTVVHKLFFLHFEKSHVESWTHNDKKSCPIEQDIVLTGSMIVHEISMQ